jgi:hypothetical protein
VKSWIDWIVRIAKVIVRGREAGLWNEGQKPGINREDPEPFNKPHQAGRSGHGR